MLLLQQINHSSTLLQIKFPLISCVIVSSSLLCTVPNREKPHCFLTAGVLFIVGGVSRINPSLFFFIINVTQRELCPVATVTL